MEINSEYWKKYVETLADVADKANDAIGGFSIGASIEVVMKPVKEALQKLHDMDSGPDDLKAHLAGVEKELAELKAELNKPEVTNFVGGVVLEAAHQRLRWGTAHDAGKTPADWFWLLGHLGTKAVVLEGGDKRRHRIIACAAVCVNWFLHEMGVNTSMRPGIQGPEESSNGG